MDDYLYRIVSASNLMEIHLLGEEMIYVMDNEKLHCNEKRKIQKENIFNEGVYHSIHGE